MISEVLRLNTKSRCSRCCRAHLYCGSTGNYITDSLVPALGMEVIPEKGFGLLEIANKMMVKAQGYISFRLDSGEFSYRVHCLGVSQPEIISDTGNPMAHQGEPRH